MKNGKFDADAKVLRASPAWDPKTVFSEVFGGTSKTDGRTDDKNDRRASILDNVQKVSKVTLDRMSQADRQLVENHLDTVRQLEVNLMAAGTCTPPRQPETVKTMIDGKLDYHEDTLNKTAPRVASDMRDLMSVMFACDYARTFVFQASAPISGFNMEHFIDMEGLGPRPVRSLHRDSHDHKAHHKVSAPWFMGQLAAIIKSLAETNEGANKAIDNSLIWATSENGPQVHSLENIATIVAGGPSLVRGNYYQNPGSRTIADMHLGLLKALNLDDSGYKAWVKPPNANPVDLMES